MKILKKEPIGKNIHGLVVGNITIEVNNNIIETKYHEGGDSTYISGFIGKYPTGNKWHHAITKIEVSGELTQYFAFNKNRTYVDGIYMFDKDAYMKLCKYYSIYYLPKNN